MTNGKDWRKAVVVYFNVLFRYVPEERRGKSQDSWSPTSFNFCIVTGQGEVVPVLNYAPHHENLPTV
jgi:hypothetical protein